MPVLARLDERRTDGAEVAQVVSLERTFDGGRGAHNPQFLSMLETRYLGRRLGAKLVRDMLLEVEL